MEDKGLRKNKRYVLIWAAVLILISLAATGCTFAKKTAEKKSEVKAAQEQKKEEPEEEEKEEEKTEEYKKGTVNGSHFESEWMNIRIDLPESLTMASDEDIADAVDVGKAYTTEERADLIEETYEQGTVIYEMMAAAAPGIPNINIVVQNTGMKNITSKQLAEYAKQNLESSLEEGAAYTPVEDIHTVEIAGESYECLKAKLSANGVQINSGLYVRVKSEYSIEMILSILVYTFSQECSTLCCLL